ncbi:alpha/beta hydrolase [Paraburkholderia sp.]|uniref:alpha/beta hydrolase n=1 Tax=Paraburkholderia sp. TaxID=1926495 RepID=UPI003D6F06F2
MVRRILIAAVFACASVAASIASIASIVTAAQPATTVGVPIERTPVPAVETGRFTVSTARGAGDMPIETSLDWSAPQPDVTRAVVVIHGSSRRDMPSARNAARRAGDAAAHTLIVTPQFLIPTDIAAHALPNSVLRWSLNDWSNGYDAQGPAPISSFDVLDAIFARLADRQRFPQLREVVLAGHSAGAQLVQRYIALGRGTAVLDREHVHVRFVIANPSSYLYFDRRRPSANGTFAVDTGTSCPHVDQWKFGLSGGLPRYAGASVDAAKIERRYLARDVVYLLGTADNDPAHPELDRSCAARAQGATRYARGLAYFGYLHLLDRHVGQQLLEVDGVGHHSSQMFASPQGLAALFGFDDTQPPARRSATHP